MVHRVTRGKRVHKVHTEHKVHGKRVHTSCGTVT